MSIGLWTDQAADADAAAFARTATTARRRALPITLPQSKILTSTEPVIGYVAGRGSGKTWIGAYRILSRSKPGDPWLCVSPDAGVVLDTTLPTFLELAHELGVYRKHVVSPYPRVWWDAGPGKLAQIVFRSGEKPDKLRGPNKAGLWIDEAAIQPEDVYKIARATLRHKGVMGPTILTTTPRGRAHWTFGVFYVPAPNDTGPGVEIIQGVPYRRRDNRELIQASTRDNPFLPDEFYAEMGTSYSSILAMQELEGLFVDIEGLMFQRHWFIPVDAAPRNCTRVRYWDRAASVLAHSSFTAGVLVARDERGLYYIEDVVRGQWTAADRDRVILQTAQADRDKYRGEVLIYAEQEGGSGGKEVMQQMIKALAGFPVYRDLASASGLRTVGGVKLPGGPKITRAQPLAAQAEAGNVYIVAGKWNNEYLGELCAFPESKFSDQVDASAAGMNRLAALAQPDEVVSEKERVSVDSARFGLGVTLAGQGTRAPERRKLFGKE